VILSVQLRGMQIDLQRDEITRLQKALLQKALPPERRGKSRYIKGTVLSIDCEIRWGVAVYGASKQRAHAAVQAAVLAGQDNFAWDLAHREGLQSIAFEFVGNDSKDELRKLPGHFVRLRLIPFEGAVEPAAIAFARSIRR